VTELRGASVVLRPLAAADTPALLRILRTPEVAAWWGAPDPGFPETDDPQATRFAVLVDGQVEGLIQYGEEDEPAFRHAWIDIFLEPRVHGRGLGSDAVRTLADHLVAARGHHRITIDPAAGNAPAVKAYAKAGFRTVGTMRRAWRDPQGRWQDQLLMERVEPEL
jgi:aminoglycoside 6'-N-acetyltransferase